MFGGKHSKRLRVLRRSSCILSGLLMIMLAMTLLYGSQAKAGPFRSSLTINGTRNSHTTSTTSVTPQVTRVPAQGRSAEDTLQRDKAMQTLQSQAVTPLKSGQMVWSRSSDSVLIDAPATRHTIAHVGPAFPLVLAGGSAWSGGVLWYHVNWSTPKSSDSGWIAAANVSFVSPGNVATSASLEILLPALAQYLHSIGTNVGVEVYDISRQRYYGYNGDNEFISGSAIKVPIMLSYLDLLEQNGQALDDNGQNLLTSMIENSDNDAASELYYNQINGAQGISNYMQKIGIGGISANSGAWGYSQISPLAMVQLLTLLQRGQTLTSDDRALALQLMENVESDQRAGVGDSAPDGATVAMKNGWVVGPDGLWDVNSSGIVTAGKETYVIVVCTQGQPTQDAGDAITHHIAASVASALL